MNTNIFDNPAIWCCVIGLVGVLTQTIMGLVFFNKGAHIKTPGGEIKINARLDAIEKKESSNGNEVTELHQELKEIKELLKNKNNAKN